MGISWRTCPGCSPACCRSFWDVSCCSSSAATSTMPSAASQAASSARAAGPARRAAASAAGGGCRWSGRRAQHAAVHHAAPRQQAGALPEREQRAGRRAPPCTARPPLQPLAASVNQPVRAGWVPHPPHHNPPQPTTTHHNPTPAAAGGAAAQRRPPANQALFLNSAAITMSGARRRLQRSTCSRPAGPGLKLRWYWNTTMPSRLACSRRAQRGGWGGGGGWALRRRSPNAALHRSSWDRGGCRRKAGAPTCLTGASAWWNSCHSCASPPGASWPTLTCWLLACSDAGRCWRTSQGSALAGTLPAQKAPNALKWKRKPAGVAGGGAGGRRVVASGPGPALPPPAPLWERGRAPTCAAGRCRQPAGVAAGRQVPRLEGSAAPSAWCWRAWGWRSSCCPPAAARAAGGRRAARPAGQGPLLLGGGARVWLPTSTQAKCLL
jgi:hypothetical protein